MLTILHGVPWIHVTPALLAVVIGLLYLKTKWTYLKAIWGILWLLFLPNTSYIFTDIIRISLHWNSASMIMHIALVFQYILLELIGLITYLVAMLPFENMIRTWHFSKKAQLVAIIVLNFFIGFGMVLGRTGYTNSYVLFTQPIKVFIAALNIIISFKLLGLVALFGIFCNGIYFLFRNRLLNSMEKQKLL